MAGTVLPASRYPVPADRDAFYQRVLERVREFRESRVPATRTIAPLVVKGGRSVTFVEGRPRPAPRGGANDREQSWREPGLPRNARRAASQRPIHRRARHAERAGRQSSTRRWRAYWPDQDPLGQRFTSGADRQAFTVVGVVGDIRQSGLDVPAVPEVYVPLDQPVAPFMWPNQLVVRSGGDPLALASACAADLGGRSGPARGEFVR